METTTSFDLNLSIRQWCEDLGQSPAFRDENLHELESHLRDSIATLQTRGLSAEEAFMVAAKRIGKGGALESEFGKVNGTAVWLDRLFWMLIGYQVWLFVSGVIGLITEEALYFGLSGAGYDFKLHGCSIPVTLFTLVHLAGIAGSLAFCWWLFCRKGQRFSLWLGRLLHRRTNWALTYGALFLIAVSIGMVRGGTMPLLIKSVGHQKFEEIVFSQSISSAITHLIAIAVSTWLILFLARKRLRVS